MIEKVLFWSQIFEIEILMDLHTPRQKSIRALEIFPVQKLILNATS